MKEIKDYSLLPHNTFGMDVKASLFVEYESVTELQSILSDKKLMAGNWLHIGGGSNLLFKGDYAGTVRIRLSGGMRWLLKTNRK